MELAPARVGLLPPGASLFLLILPFTQRADDELQQVNRGKRSVGLDFKKEEGKEILRELVKRADVLVRPRPSLSSDEKAQN